MTRPTDGEVTAAATELVEWVHATDNIVNLPQSARDVRIVAIAVASALSWTQGHAANIEPFQALLGLVREIEAVSNRRAKGRLN